MIYGTIIVWTSLLNHSRKLHERLLSCFRKDLKELSVTIDIYYLTQYMQGDEKTNFPIIFKALKKVLKSNRKVCATSNRHETQIKTIAN